MSWRSAARSSTACTSTTAAPPCSAGNPHEYRHAPRAGQRSRPAASGRGGSFAASLRYFLRLGILGFGGPIAMVGYMQRDRVEQHGWIAKQDFLDGVALGQTMPGQLAAQVAMWVGYLKRGALGAVATALTFIAPSFLMVTTVAAVYVRYAGLGAVQALFHGIAPAVMAIIAIAAYKLVKLTDGKDWRAWAISAVVVLTRQAVTDWPTIAIALVTLGPLWRYKIPEPYVVIAAGALGLLLYTRTPKRR
ncbi:chromate transporter [Streptomyces sp. NPDC048527]|uniref:chromate transporter n=1 Tax=Streptomyces sp. NPDC048527 TaxID=3365568 RepID=UPI00371AAF40